MWGGLIITGLVVLVLFVAWQWLLERRGGGEPLLPLGLFKDRNFSLGNTAIMAVGFTVTAFPLPTIFYYQTVRGGLTPTQSALLMIPMAVISGALAPPFVGKLIDRANPRWFASFGLVCLAGALFWTASLLGGPDTPIWMFLLPSALQGVANAFIWGGPVSNATTRNLEPRQAGGAGSGVFNTTRQIGAVLGSAAIAALIQSRLAAELPAAPAGAPVGEASMGGVLPEALHAGFSTAMSQSILLPACAILLGAVVALFFGKPKSVSGWGGGSGWRAGRTGNCPEVAFVRCRDQPAFGLVLPFLSAVPALYLPKAGPVRRFVSRGARSREARRWQSQGCGPSRALRCC